MPLDATEDAQSAAVPPAGTPQPAAAAPGAAGPPRAAPPPQAAPPPDMVPPPRAAWPPDTVQPPGGLELPEAVERTELVGLAEPAEAGEPAHRRHRLALAVLFTVAALAIVGGAVGTVGALTHGFRKHITVTYHQSAVFTLQTGDCIDTPNAQKVSVLPCSTPHQAEVFATFSLPASAWPGTATVRTEASSGCASRLTGYLNPQLAISLKQSYVFPDEVAWTAGTRTVICEVQATSGQLTGSVRAAS